jgi:capsular polysaccharide transport system permease protein
MNEIAEQRVRPVRTGFQIQRDVIYALVLREVGARLGKSRVGLIWVLLEPVAHLVFPIVMFGFLLERALPGVDYPIFLVYGFLPFLLFKTICLQTMDGVSANRGLLSYRQITLMDVFIAKALAHCAIEAIVFGVVLSGLAMMAFDVVPAHFVEFAGVLVLTVVMAFGLGLLFAAIGSLVPDAKSVIRLMFLPLYLASGVLFPISRFPDEWIDWFALNPVLHLVELSRATAIEHYEPMRQLNSLFPLTIALATNFIGLAMYRLRYLSRVTT